LTSCDLQLDVSLYFFSHFVLLAGTGARVSISRSPGFGPFSGKLKGLLSDKALLCRFASVCIFVYLSGRSFS